MSEQIDFVGVLQFIERLSMLRVYGQLANSPALYWENNEDPDSLYLKSQRAWVSRYMGEYLGGRRWISGALCSWTGAGSGMIFGFRRPEA